MLTVGAYEAKTHLPRLLEEVSRGQKVTITRRGEPVALLVPVPEENSADAATAVEALRRWRDERRLILGAGSVRSVVEEGRR